MKQRKAAVRVVSDELDKAIGAARCHQCGPVGLTDVPAKSDFAIAITEIII
jgi:hypothetical protein